ncbi:acyltransferase [Novosphingobium sp. MW5]|nr:acyltransferase [Novosphingobium sp. MW5]
MASTPASSAKPAHHNAFGFLRLVFASLVIVSHAPNMIDGDSSREPLYSLTGTMSLGGVAVNGFFLISGYLVVASFCKQPTVFAYLTRRIARIVPGYVVACLFCILIVAPLSGVSLEVLRESAASLATSTLKLEEPVITGTFAGTPFPALNGSMWTITYEFRAYLLVIVLGLAGLYRWRIGIPLIAGSVWLGFEVTNGFIEAPHLLSALSWLYPKEYLAIFLELLFNFLVGSTFYLYRDRIALRPGIALLAAALLVPALFVPPLAVPAFAVLGGYIIFTVGFGVTRGPLARINNANDISYGVYLYAWPVGKLLLWYWPAMPLVLCILLNWLIACALGWISWHIVEKPAMRYLTKMTRLS